MLLYSLFLLGSKKKGITKNVLLRNFEFLKKIEQKILDRFFKVFGLECSSDFMIFEEFVKFYKLFNEKNGAKNDYVEFIVKVDLINFINYVFCLLKFVRNS